MTTFDNNSPNRPTPQLRPSSGRVTLNAVAERAGVSSMTVSRCLNSPDKVSEKIRHRVMQAVNETGYVPNALAGGLASSSIPAIGLIVPTLRTSLYSRMLAHFQKYSASMGLQLIVAADNHDVVERERLVRTFLGWQVGGLFLVGLNHSPTIYEMIRQTKTFCVSLSDSDTPNGYDESPYVVGYSHYQGGYDMGKRLAQAGHKRICYVSNTDSTHVSSSQNRRDGFVAGVQDHGAEFTGFMSVQGEAIVADGAKSIDLIDVNAHDAVMFSADDLAVGAVLAWQRRGVKIPHDIAVAGFHGTDTGSYLTPALSTIANPRGKMVQHAMNLLQKHQNGETIPEKIHTLDFYFRQGESF